MSEERKHVSVLFQEVMDFLLPHDGGRYIDGTLGAGGHSAGILNASSPTGRLLGFDADPKALAVAKENLAQFGERATLVHSNFQNLKLVAEQNNFVPVDGIVLDLGLSSMQLADAERGFSFLTDGALDMRFNPDEETDAAELVNTLSEQDLADLIYEYGEEHASRRIARGIVYARPIKTAAQLASVIERSMGRRGRIHPATQTFQALRIAVNREIDVLENVLPQVVELLKPQGRIAIISFHSLEDRVVKNFFRSSDQLQVLTKHPVRPSDDEVQANSRSRSAKLRVAEKVDR
jgi:16S rRNA (cytosine1402-N4)-methyltransferase